MPACPCQQAGECPMELIPDCAACDGFSTMGYMAAMAYRLEARVAALEAAYCPPPRALDAGGPSLPPALKNRILDALENELCAGCPEPAASKQLSTASSTLQGGPGADIGTSRPTEQQRDSRAASTWADYDGTGQPHPYLAAAPAPEQAAQPAQRPCDKCDWSGDRPDCEVDCDAWEAWRKGYLLNETPAQRPQPEQQPRNCDNCRFAKVSEWKPPCFNCQLHGGNHDAWQPREGDDKRWFCPWCHDDQREGGSP